MREREASTAPGVSKNFSVKIHARKARQQISGGALAGSFAAASTTSFSLRLDRALVERSARLATRSG
ncbi:MAG TPA: hypothetical protein VKH43_03860 [Thermoanaerobaculia bacterium]|nr:hypothetical protein [Thermoanaerobaculia bacterium]